MVATGWEPVLKEAKEAKIPVFLLDRSIDVKDKDLYMTTVTANNVLEGQLIGDWLVKTVDGKPCNVVELQGTVGASVAIDRKERVRRRDCQSVEYQNYPLSVRRLHPQQRERGDGELYQS